MLDKLLHFLKEKELFFGGHTTLWKLHKKIRFRYKKVNDKRYVYEQPKIILQRHQYIRRMRRNRREDRPVVYFEGHGQIHIVVMRDRGWSLI